ncbi:MAG: hypothetical protein OXI87_09860 [Albidovulum sp.]|nr:hypothetical protein [Albidovulum sp.]MDE0305173.1 hypothetical protein [Albidovulum sp.]MDE0530237.1 hypothetical protein [Albidovulum sp.]
MFERESPRSKIWGELPGAAMLQGLREAQGIRGGSQLSQNNLPVADQIPLRIDEMDREATRKGL